MGRIRKETSSKIVSYFCGKGKKVVKKGRGEGK